MKKIDFSSPKGCQPIGLFATPIQEVNAREMNISAKFPHCLAILTRPRTGSQRHTLPNAANVREEAVVIKATLHSTYSGPSGRDGHREVMSWVFEPTLCTTI